MALTTFSDLVQEAREQVRRDALAAGVSDDGKALRDGGTGATAHAEAVGVYLAFLVDLNSQITFRSICSMACTERDTQLRNTFARQALPDDMGLCRKSITLLRLHQAVLTVLPNGTAVKH